MPSTTRRAMSSTTRRRATPGGANPFLMAPWFPLLGMNLMQGYHVNPKKVKKARKNTNLPNAPLHRDGTDGLGEQVQETELEVPPQTPTHTLAGVSIHEMNNAQIAGDDSSMSGASASSNEGPQPPSIGEEEEDHDLQARFWEACHRKLVGFKQFARLPRPGSTACTQG